MVDKNNKINIQNPEDLLKKSKILIDILDYIILHTHKHENGGWKGKRSGKFSGYMINSCNLIIFNRYLHNRKKNFETTDFSLLLDPPSHLHVKYFHIIEHYWDLCPIFFIALKLSKTVSVLDMTKYSTTFLLKFFFYFYFIITWLLIS